MNKRVICCLRLALCMLMVGTISIHAQRVSFNGERMSLKKAFERIEQLSKYKSNTMCRSSMPIALSP